MITPFPWTTVIQKKIKPLNMRMGGFERLPLKFLQEARIRGHTGCCKKIPMSYKSNVSMADNVVQKCQKILLRKKLRLDNLSAPLCKYHCPQHSSLTMTNAERICLHHVTRQCWCVLTFRKYCFFIGKLCISCWVQCIVTTGHLKHQVFAFGPNVTSEM